MPSVLPRSSRRRQVRVDSLRGTCFIVRPLLSASLSTFRPQERPIERTGKKAMAIAAEDRRARLLHLVHRLQPGGEGPHLAAPAAVSLDAGSHR